MFGQVAGTDRDIGENAKIYFHALGDSKSCRINVSRSRMHYIAFTTYIYVSLRYPPTFNTTELTQACIVTTLHCVYC